MQAEAYIQSGELEKALDLLTKEIRKNQAKVELRIFLFQLLSVLGQWERAIIQLNVAAEMDSDAWLMAQIYRSALNCEVLRDHVFQGKRTPLCFGEPLAWMAWLTRIPALLASGQSKMAADLRDQAFDAAPAISGQINGQAFTWIADADERLGPTLEAIINGKYYWIPFERIRQIRIDKPINLRDAIWTTATFTWTNQGHAVGLIPSRYPGSEKVEDNSLRMSRKTDWRDVGNNFFIGMGQRMLVTDQGEYPILDIREVIINPLDTPSKEKTGNG
jgi:type VI secretion system protein ImpE